ncbi:MAG: efflux RND transporter periplasmic adaptor subunit [Planctomycetota bacterium]|nr:efflux RND transporter periplasmic adaptor subunit [Planctomycetota bacterium]
MIRTQRISSAHARARSLTKRRSRGNARFAVPAVLVLGLVGLGVWYGFLRPAGDATSDRPLTEPMVRGPLRVTVIESGSLEALRSHSIVNTVEGRTVIDFVVEEGTVLTQEDVAAGRVLVRLNTASLDDKRVQEEIEISGARDAVSGAETNLEIQIQQNASDLRKADLEVRFARLDLARYVGKSYAERLIAVAGVDTSAQAFDPEGADPAAIAAAAEASEARIAEGVRRLIAELLESEELEGESLQTIRQLTSDIRLAEEELRRATDRLRNSEKLEAKGYVSREDLEADRLALERREIEVQRARTAREQYVAYDFPKAVERLLSDLLEAIDRRTRAAKKADAEEAQKISAVEAKRRQLELKERRLESLAEQAKGCVLRATKPGLVVYASSQSGHWRGNDERVHEGASVREGQTLITIPDPTSLGVILKVHETAIDKVHAGLDAFVEVDAAPGQRFRGRVAEVARLPDSADRWLNPDLKVYTTKVELLGTHEGLKPGMSAQVEIVVTTIPDVLSAPVQTVTGTADQPAVYVWADGRAQRRPVTLGLASEHFVEIKGGVEVGDRLLLDPPRDAGRGPRATRDGDEPATDPAPSVGGADAPRPPKGGGKGERKGDGDAQPGDGKAGDGYPRGKGKRGGKGAGSGPDNG